MNLKFPWFFIFFLIIPCDKVKLYNFVKQKPCCFSCMPQIYFEKLKSFCNAEIFFWHIKENSNELSNVIADNGILLACAEEKFKSESRRPWLPLVHPVSSKRYPSRLKSRAEFFASTRDGCLSPRVCLECNPEVPF